MPQVLVRDTYEDLTPEEIAKGNPATAKRIFAYHWMTNDPALRFREYRRWETIAPVIQGATLKGRGGFHITEKSYLATRKYTKRKDVYILADGSEFIIEY